MIFGRAASSIQAACAAPKGAPEADWEDREQTLFRATDFGDDVDRPLMKSDGGYTIIRGGYRLSPRQAPRGFDTMIDVWARYHGGYIRRMKAAVKAISAGAATLDIEICQLVKLLRDGVE